MTTILLGCDAPLQVDYGRVGEITGKSSVNGLGVLGELFTQTGANVRRWRRLSPRIRRADVIVWAPDSFQPPNVEQRAFLENWLQSEKGKTLVYIGRDFDAESTYWEKLLSAAPADQVDFIKTRRAKARDRHELARKQMPADQFAQWFVVRRNDSPRRARTLDGPWHDGVDVSKVNIRIDGTLDIPLTSDLPPGLDEASMPIFEELLRSDDQVLAFRIRYVDWRNSQIVVVCNGSFLLNVPLVDHEHRKLAARFINEAVRGKTVRKIENVVFLESSGPGPEVYDKEPKMNWFVGFEVFNSWPLGMILIHLSAVGFVYCICHFPIFGRPRERKHDDTSDFGKHVDAIGKHLRRIGDSAYADARIEEYRRTVRGYDCQ